MTPSKGHNDSVEIEPDLNQTYEVSEKKNRKPKKCLGYHLENKYLYYTDT